MPPIVLDLTMHVLCLYCDEDRGPIKWTSQTMITAWVNDQLTVTQFDFFVLFCLFAMTSRVIIHEQLWAMTPDLQK